VQQPNDSDDPIVLIFQLAYRRGLEIMQNQTADTTRLNDNLPDGRETVTRAARGDNSRNVSAKGQQNAGTTKSYTSKQ